MANSIGSQNFVSLTGPLQPLGEMPEVFERPGIDGHAARRLGDRGARFQMVSFVDVAAFADILNKTSDYKALAGVVVVVTDGFGNTWNNVLVRDVTVTAVPRLVVATGGINPPSVAGLIATWDLQFIGEE